MLPPAAASSPAPLPVCLCDRHRLAHVLGSFSAGRALWRRRSHRLRLPGAAAAAAVCAYNVRRTCLYWAARRAARADRRSRCWLALLVAHAQPHDHLACTTQAAAARQQWHKERRRCRPQPSAWPPPALPERNCRVRKLRSTRRRSDLEARERPFRSALIGFGPTRPRRRRRRHLGPPQWSGTQRGLLRRPNWRTKGDPEEAPACRSVGWRASERAGPATTSQLDCKATPSRPRSPSLSLALSLPPSAGPSRGSGCTL